MESKRLTDEIKSKLKALGRDMIIADVIAVVLGLVLVIFPDVSANVIFRVVGALLCIFGGQRTAQYFVSGPARSFGMFSLIIGTASFIFGLWFLIRPEVLSTFLANILGAILIIVGLLKVKSSADFRLLGAARWYVELIFGILLAILGIFAVINPFATTKTVMIYLGICLIGSGICDIISVIWLSSSIKKIKNDKSFYSEADEDDIPTVDE